MNTREDFWKLIADANDAVNDLFIEEYLIGKLVQMTNRDITRFEEILGELMFESYRWDWWAAAEVMNGGCDDDSFEEFRAWVISQGQGVYQMALRNPDDLADCLVASLIDPNDEDNEFAYPELLDVTVLAFAQKNNCADVEEAYDHPEYDPQYHPCEIQGEEWTEADLPKIVPKLCTLFKSGKQSSGLTIQSKQDFWALIEEARNKVGSYDIADYLTKRLSKTNEQDIVRFRDILQELMTESYRSDFLASLFVMTDYAGDDGFSYFRTWIIAQGQQVYESALANPDNLADILQADATLMQLGIENAFNYEELRYVCVHAYTMKNNLDKPDDEDIEDRYYLTEDNELAFIGDEWTEADLPKIVPKLCTLFQYEVPAEA